MDRFFFPVINMQLPSRFMTSVQHLERSLFAWSKRWKGANHEPANPAWSPAIFGSQKLCFELNARERAQALLDEGGYRELLGPFERLESPWLLLQGVVPQADDGLIVCSRPDGRNRLRDLSYRRTISGVAVIGEVSWRQDLPRRWT